MALSFAGGGCGTCSAGDECLRIRNRKGTRVGQLRSIDDIIYESMTYLQLGAPRQHPLKGDANPLNNGQQDGAANGTVPCGFVTPSNSQRATGEEAGDDGIVGVLLLSDALDGAVEGGEETTPDAKVAAQDGGSHFDRSDGANATLAVGGVSEALDAVPYSATDCLQRERIRQVVSHPHSYVWEREIGIEGLHEIVVHGGLHDGWM